MSRERDELPPEDVPTEDYEARLPAESAFQRWLFFDASRWTLVVVLLVVIAASFFIAGRTGLVSYRNESTGALFLSVVVAGNFTLVSIVITINQLVLSREFGKPHVLRQRNEGILDFREDVTRLTGGGAGPADPLVFVRRIVRSVEDRVTELRDDVDAGEPRLVESVESLSTAVSADAKEADDALSDSEVGNFRVLTTLLFFRIAWQLHTLRRIRTEFDESLDESTVATVEELERLLQDLNIARQYLQTLYMQKELGQLSRLLLYVGIPSLIVSGLGMLVYRPGAGVTVPRPLLVPTYSVVAAVGFLPLAILLSYMVRISTIVSRMPLLNPFLTDG